MSKRVKRALIGVGLSLVMGVTAGFVWSPQELTANNCMQNHRCVVRPDGDSCDPGGFYGCYMIIETCAGC